MHPFRPPLPRAASALRTLALALALGVAVTLNPSAARASPVLSDVNGAGTPGDFVFGPSTIGWSWTAPLSFTWDGLGSTFKSCCQFNILSPSQVTLTIATDTPANGGVMLFSGLLDATGHASFAGISVQAGNSYFIGLSGLTGSSPFAVGVNIVNWVPEQPVGTVNLSGWYTGSNFETFIPQSVVGGVQQQPFSAPILRFEGVAAVPEPAAWALLVLGLGVVRAARGRGARAAQSARAPVA